MKYQDMTTEELLTERERAWSTNDETAESAIESALEARERERGILKD